MEPYYENRLVRLYHGDCLEVMPQLEDKFDCCITDPPYGTTACKWDVVIPFEPMWKCIWKMIRPDGAVCLFGSEPFSSTLRNSDLDHFKYDWIWRHGRCANFAQAPYMPMKEHEIISVFSLAGCAKNAIPRMAYNPQGITHGYRKCPGKKENPLRPRRKTQEDYVQEAFGYPKSVLDFPKEQNKFHPTQKPVSLIEYLVRTYTDENDLVLDFSCGSGTTGVACMNTGRRCVLIEKEERYCEVSAKRLEGGRDLFNMYEE